VCVCGQMNDCKRYDTSLNQPDFNDCLSSISVLSCDFVHSSPIMRLFSAIYYHFIHLSDCSFYPLRLQFWQILHCKKKYCWFNL